MVPSRPLAGSVVHVQDFDGLLFHAVGRNIRQSAEQEFPRAFFSARASAMR